MQPLALPHGVDDPPSLLLWRLDDLIPLILMLVIGMLTDRLAVFLVLGVMLSRLYGRFRDSRPDGFALHWTGPGASAAFRPPATASSPSARSAAAYAS